MTRITTAVRALFILLAVAAFSACNQNNDDSLDVPATYEFTRGGNSTVSFSGQTERLDMLALISTYLKTTNTVGSSALDADLLKNMFRNSNDPFTGSSYSKNLISKCFAADTILFLQLMDEAAIASAASGTASNGIAGVLVDGSSDPTVGYRVNESGIELTQVIEKGLMGAVFFYQAMEVYLSDDRMSEFNNSSIVEGETHTNMEHYFDEAFGYFGAPVDFPSTLSLDDARFWAKYCNSRNEGLYEGINADMSRAFRTARAAIAAKDYETRNASIQEIQEKWAIICAASAVDYLNQALSTSGNPEYRRHHAASEAIGFMMALKYHFNGGNSMYPPVYNYTHIEEALLEVGLNSNLYALSDTEIQSAIDHIRMAFPTGQIK